MKPTKKHMKNAVLRFLNEAIIAYVKMKNGSCRGGLGWFLWRSPCRSNKEPLSSYGFTCTIAADPERLTAEQASWGSSGKLYGLKLHGL